MLMQEERELVVEYGKKMSAARLSTGTSGNISIYNAEKGLVALSPSGMDYFSTTPEDVVILDLDAKVVDGKRKPSSEWALHTKFYRRHPAARAVVHTHSMYCTTLACLGKPLEAVHYAIGAAGTARIPVAPYRLFGSPELAEANQAAWATPGLLKITHTRTDVSEAADLDAAAVDALTVELNAFLNTARVDESVHAAVKAEREKLVEEHRRVAANLRAVRAAVEKKLASEVKTESEAKPVEGEVKTEGEEVKPEGGDKPESEKKPVESEEKPAPKSDELRELDTEEGELDDILRSIQSDKYMCSGEEHIQSPCSCGFCSGRRPGRSRET